MALETQQLRMATMRIRSAEKHLSNLLKKLYPLGSSVSYVKHGYRIQHGTVIDHGFWDDRLRIETAKGAKIWISSYHILNAIDPDPASM